FTGKEFALAKVGADGQSLNVSIDLKAGGGTVQSSPAREPREVEKAPFAVGGGAGGRGGRGSGKRGGAARGDADGPSSGLRLNNPMTGGVSGRPADEKPETDLGWRQFLLGLHKAHGYPGEVNGRWVWALFADAMALTTCFWGLSGLLMWWQVK